MLTRSYKFPGVGVNYENDSTCEFILLNPPRKPTDRINVQVNLDQVLTQHIKL